MSTTRAQLRISILAAVAATLLAPSPVSALDLTAELLLGNMNMDWSATSPVSAAEYPANLWVYGAEISLTERLGDAFVLETSYVTDPILRHILRSVVAYESGIVRIAAGPVLGAFNTASTPIKAGISVGLRVDLPGWAFVSARADSSMGAGLIAVGDYAQELAELQAGWYVYNAICSASVLTRKFYHVVAAGDILADSSNRYAFGVDVFKKGSPYRVKLDFGYQDITRSYPDLTIDKLGIVFIGARLNAAVSPMLNIIADLESSVYAFGLEALAGRGPDSNAFIFRASLGVGLKLGQQNAPPLRDETLE
ncbi:MAG TPA: hypothetical protein DCG47_00745 [Spirochaetaceae bacterium]|nr:hypothetical protein [Spirochaetaceae bacterium]